MNQYEYEDHQLIIKTLIGYRVGAKTVSRLMKALAQKLCF
ncbi:hypothetical protein Bhyg_07214 [Pseudolycoriella hygida]|uniref:Uncharacterized protein n=1 Tax=Pseudolycoriella hygida TaxID=35572 RepID=A0A9Q0S1S5_9DIPT|nr:hypothetical protein Bhyg_07214 [Pseudolycoriella hygida]